MKSLFFFLLSLFYVQQSVAQKAVPPKFDKPTAVLHNQNEGMFYQPYLLKAKKIDVISGEHNTEKFTIHSYTVVALNYSDTLFTMKNIQGNAFPKEAKDAFKKIGHHGKLIFYEITAIGADNRIIDLSPMEFTITKK